MISALSIFERIGRFVIDFGFGSLIDKYESYFGRRITGTFLAIVGMAAVVIVAGAAWDAGLGGLFRWTRDTVEGSSAAYLAYRIISTVAALGFLISAGATIAGIVHMRSHFTQVELELGRILVGYENIQHSMVKASSILVGASKVAKEIEAERGPNVLEVSASEINELAKAAKECADFVREQSEEVRAAREQLMAMITRYRPVTR